MWSISNWLLFGGFQDIFVYLFVVSYDDCRFGYIVSVVFIWPFLLFSGLFSVMGVLLSQLLFVCIGHWSCVAKPRIWVSLAVLYCSQLYGYRLFSAYCLSLFTFYLCDLIYIFVTVIDDCLWRFLVLCLFGSLCCLRFRDSLWIAHSVKDSISFCTDPLLCCMSYLGCWWG